MAAQVSSGASPSQREYLSGSTLNAILMSEDVGMGAPRLLRWHEKFDHAVFMISSRYTLLIVIWSINALVFSFGLSYYGTDIFATGGSDTSATLAIAHAAGLVLHFDVALVLLPTCRTLISILRETPIHAFLREGSGLSSHHMLGWSMVVFAWIHAIAHWVSFVKMAKGKSLGLERFLILNLATGSGWSGHIMLVLLMLMAATSTVRVRVNKWGRFWGSHHLFIALFILWSVHAAFTITKAEIHVSWAVKATFWQYWICGASLYLIEKVLQEVRVRHKMQISKVIQHPNRVVEIQIKKKAIIAEAGQAQSLAASLGCKFDHTGFIEATSVVGIDEKSAKFDVDPTIRNYLPPVSVDGPYGHAPRSLFQKDVAILVATGSMVVFCASILKSIWYRMNFAYEKTALRKVYLFWLCDDIGGLEWFKSLALAVEAQDLDGNIEIHPYFTACYKENLGTSTSNTTATTNEDIFTGLRFPVVFSQPNWDAVLMGVTQLDKPVNLGVFPSGPLGLVGDLRLASNRYRRQGRKLELSRIEI